MRRPLVAFGVSPAIQTHDLRKVYPAPRSLTWRRAGRGAQAAGTQSESTPGWGSGGAAGAGTNGAASHSAAANEIEALVGLDLAIEEGELFGLLGPNGAGKTTTIGILTTRVKPTAGTAVVAGADVTTDPVAVRQRIGVVPQRPNPDRSLSVVENLVFHAAYFGIANSRATQRAFALLDRFGIADKAAAKVDELSGGQQQRLMIARALIHEPSIVFLDEPTVGLDPQARLALWTILRELHEQRRTIIMTTHYMEEADQLCERIAIVDEGRLLAVDTPAALKARAPGGTLIELTLDGDADAVAPGARQLPHVSRVDVRNGVLRAFSDRAGQVIPALIDVVQSNGRIVKNISLGAPSLETLFISLTGRKLN
jgi:ABC-2 type transport system ATP-binding protein